ncbi:hypothetical protein KCU61_g107, partial [Aureobasidium melanogenum]
MTPICVFSSMGTDAEGCRGRHEVDREFLELQHARERDERTRRSDGRQRRNYKVNETDMGPEQTIRGMPSPLATDLSKNVKDVISTSSTRPSISSIRDITYPKLVYVSLSVEPERLLVVVQTPWFTYKHTLLPGFGTGNS